MDVKRLAIALLLTAAVPGSAQSMRPADLAPGKILIAPRDCPDPHFAHSVIVLASYNQSGALGLMIHYRSTVPIQKALAGMKGADKRPDPLFVGGPVEMETVMGLLKSTSPPHDATHVIGNLYLVASKQSLGTALSEGRKPSELRIFVGYTGWGPGQLDREMQLNGWYIFNHDEALVFDDHPETLWDRLIAKTQLLQAFLFDTSVPCPFPQETSCLEPSRKFR